MTIRRAVTWLIALAAVALIAVGVVLLLAARPPAEFGTDADAGLAAPSSAPAETAGSPQASASGSTPASAQPAASPVATASPSPEPSPTLAPLPASPRRVLIPALGVDAKVMPVGLDKARAVQVPDDISEVGWYEYSMPPGSAEGSSVLVAHRDGRVDGHGVFYDLGQLRAGDRIVVVGEDGARHPYRVRAMRLLEKSAFGDYAEALFATTGPARLRLISCGGYYDSAHGGYQSNVVVTAIPEPSADQSP